MVQVDGEAEAESKAQEGNDDEVGAGRGRAEAEAAQRYQQEHQKEDAAAELDMFAEDVVATPPVGPVGTGPTPVVKGLTDNYDDPEGYYLFQVVGPPFLAGCGSQGATSTATSHICFAQATLVTRRMLDSLQLQFMRPFTACSQAFRIATCGPPSECRYTGQLHVCVHVQVHCIIT